MTTIPHAAIEAGVAALHELDRDCAYSSRATIVGTILAAALPHLGETVTQWGIKYRDRDGNTMTMQCSSLIDADGQLHTFDTAAAATVVHRPRITGPWKPWTGDQQ